MSQEIIYFLSILKTPILKHPTPHQGLYIHIIDAILIDSQISKQKTHTIQRIQLFRIKDENTNMIQPVYRLNIQTDT